MDQVKVKYRVVLRKAIVGGEDVVLWNLTRPCTEKKAEKLFNQLIADWGLKYDKETGFDGAGLPDGAVYVYPAIIDVEA